MSKESDFAKKYPHLVERADEKYNNRKKLTVKPYKKKIKDVKKDERI